MDDEYAAAQENAAAVESERADQAKLADPGTTKEEAARVQIAREARGELIQSNARRFPESFPVQQSGAAAAIEAGDWANGERYASKALALAEASNDPQKLGDALQVRAIGALRARDYARAAADAKRLVDLRPGDKSARMLYESSKNRAAPAADAPGSVKVDALRRPAADVPAVSVWNDPRVKEAGRRAADRQAAIKRLNEALAHLQAGRPREALDAAEAARRSDPALADAHMQKAIAWSTLNELAKALLEVTKAIGLWTLQGKAGNLPAAYALRAQFGNDLKDYPAALADADKALAYDAAYAPGWLQRAKAGEAIGADVERALADYKRAAELDPRLGAAYDEAVVRLSAAAGRARPLRPGEAQSRDWLKGALAAASALLVFFSALVWRLSRRRRPAPAASGGDERRELDSQYDIVAPIGEGGMGAVYKGWDKVLKRPVAIKRLRPELQSNPRERDRFLKEAELVASLHHPHIVDIYTIIKGDDTHLVFEYVSGATLHDALNECPGRRMPPKRALEILRQIAEAVDHAHGRHVIHRDLKPSNVMLADGGWVKVMDFGIARQVLDSMLTTTNTIVGTPVYMAPEQAMGAVVKESDVFALGVTLYELLTGALPFKGTNEMNDKLEGRFVLPSVLAPELGTGLDEVLRKALAPRAEDRHHRCLDLYQAALRALNGSTTPVPR